MSRLLALATALVFPLIAHAQETVPAPRLGVATNFGQGWKPDVLAASAALPALDFRDAVYWKLVEKPDGRYVFGTSRTRYPDLLPGLGAGMSLTVNNGHPGYDDGHTPFSDRAVAGFARYAAAAVRRFPAIDAVEVGNEMNSATFVSGPGWDTDLRQRAVAYTALLRATAAEVRAADPSVRILGGAAHSIPLAWFQALFDAGAADYMDALVIHPYTVAPEQLRRQIALLRTLPAAADMPIEVTEFGTEDADVAPAYLLKSYCQMALSGVTRAVWYPLAARGDGLIPLLDADGALTPVGETYRMIAARLAGTQVTDAAPDPFTYACRFGDNRLLIWGEPRAIFLHERGLVAMDATGAPVMPDNGTLNLSMDRPLLIVSDGAPVRLGEAVTLAPQPLIADSLHQFAYPGDGPAGPFQRLVRRADKESPMETRPGQDKSAVPWTPYLGSRVDGMLRAGAAWVLPALSGGKPARVIYRYTAPEAMTVDLVVMADPAARSTDGVVVSVTRNGALVDRRTATGRLDLRYDGVSLVKGDTVDFAIGPGESAKGDVTGFRVQVRHPGQ